MKSNIKSHKEMIEYQMGYRDGFIAGTQSGNEMTADILANCTRPILFEVQEGCAFIPAVQQERTAEKVVSIGGRCYCDDCKRVVWNKSNYCDNCGVKFKSGKTL